MDHLPEVCSDFQFSHRCFNFHNWPSKSFNFFQFRHFWFFFFFQNALNSDSPESLCMVRRNHCLGHVGKKKICWGHFEKKCLNWKKLKLWGGQLWKLKHRRPNWKSLQTSKGVIRTFPESIKMTRVIWTCEKYVLFEYHRQN